MNSIERRVREEIKARLGDFFNLALERKQLEQELLNLERFTGALSSPNLDGMPRGSGVGDRVGTEATGNLSLRLKYQARLLQIENEQAEVEALIETLDTRERRLARCRYIKGMTWEQVCVAMCYGWTQTHRIHGALLDKLTAAEVAKLPYASEWQQVEIEKHHRGEVLHLHAIECAVCGWRVSAEGYWPDECPSCGRKMRKETTEA